MGLAVKHKDEHVRVSQFITDAKGHRTAAVIEIEELNRLEKVMGLIPEPEKWLYENRLALESVGKGLKQAARGRIKKLDLNTL